MPTARENIRTNRELFFPSSSAICPLNIESGIPAAYTSFAKQMHKSTLAP